MPKHRNAGGPFQIFDPGIGITGSLEVAGTIKLNGETVSAGGGGGGGGGTSISANGDRVSVATLAVSGSGTTEGSDKRADFIEFRAFGEDVGGISHAGIILGHPSGSTRQYGINFYNKGDGTPPDLGTLGKPGSRVVLQGPADGVDPSINDDSTRTYFLELPNNSGKEGQALVKGSGNNLIWAFLAAGMLVIGSGSRATTGGNGPSQAINAGEHNGCYPSGLCHTVVPPHKGYANRSLGVGGTFDGEPVPMNIGGVTYVIGNDVGLTVVDS